MKIIEKIKKQINENKILLYMKGCPDFPSCGFSDRAVKCLKLYNIKFAYVDVLEYPEIRYVLPKFSNWPTYPQLWVNGNLIGGSDIIFEMHQNGELKKIFNEI